MGRGSPFSRKRLFALHGWLGLNVGLWLCVVCFSGAIASLTYEIEWLTDPTLRIHPQGPIQWQQTYETLSRAYPGAMIYGLSAGETAVLDTLAWSSFVEYADGRWGRVRVDPYLGTIIRPAEPLYLTNFIRQLHYNAHSDLGFYIIGFLALPLLLSGITGLLFYKNWWRSFFTLRTGHGWRAFWSSAHPFIGVWSLIFALIIAITGLWYLTEDFLAEDIVFPAGPTLTAEQLVAYGPTPKLLPLEQYISGAQMAFPELDPTGIGLPESPNGSVVVTGRIGEWFSRDRANKVYVAPYSGDVIAVKKHRDSGLLTWWINAVDSLHFGYWGGLAGKVVWCVFGLSLPVLILSGAYLSFRRSGLISGSQKDNGQKVRSIWTRIPLRTFLTLGLLAAMIWTTTYSCEALRSGMTPQSVTLGSAPVGPWTASLSREDEVHLEGTTNYYLRVEAGEGRSANFKQAMLRIANSHPTTQPVIAEGPAGAMFASMPTPENLGKEVTMVLEIETWDGTRHVAEFADAWDETPTLSNSGERATPGQDLTPLSNTFVAMLTFFWVVAVTAGAVWLWIDRRVEV